MNIKLKAGLTVLGFFIGLFGLAIGIISIPTKWIKEYGVVAVEGIMVTVSFIFAYYIALDHYKSVEELKRSKRQDRKIIEEKRGSKWIGRD